MGSWGDGLIMRASTLKSYYTRMKIGELSLALLNPGGKNMVQ
jgi:hypothetical protein